MTVLKSRTIQEYYDENTGRVISREIIETYEEEPELPSVIPLQPWISPYHPPDPFWKEVGTGDPRPLWEPDITCTGVPEALAWRASCLDSLIAKANI